MIDRIRQDIQERLDQLLTEADRLRQALSALGGDHGTSTSRASRAGTARSSAPSARGRSGAATRTRRAPAATRTRSRSGAATASRSRAGSGGTKNAVLKALADANGNALTASEVAAATGLGRASVSTTLSKLARAGDVNKATRGYQLTASGSGNAAS